MIHVVDMLFIMVDLKFPLFVYTHYKSVSLNSMAQITKNIIVGFQKTTWIKYWIKKDF